MAEPLASVTICEWLGTRARGGRCPHHGGDNCLAVYVRQVEIPSGSECQEIDHWRLACPNCGGAVLLISRSCFGSDPHNTYGCSAAYCGWRGRSGLSHGSPSYIHDDALHAADAS